MTERITLSRLQSIVDRINRMMGQPLESWITMPDGRRHESVPGVYHLDGAYGGYALYRMANTAGGTSDVLGSGHVSKRELQTLMFAYIQGIYAGQEHREAEVTP